MRIRIRLFFLILLGVHVLPKFSFTQDFAFRNLNTENGLPSSEIFQVIQDSKGYIWIATNQGVCKYDGYAVECYDKLSGLSDNTVLELFEDEIGRMWCIPLSGQLCYFQNDSIVHYPYNSILAEVKKNTYAPIKQSFYANANNDIFLSFYSCKTIQINNKGELKELNNQESNEILILKKNQNRVVFNGTTASKFHFFINDYDKSIRTSSTEYSLKIHNRFCAISNDSLILYSFVDRLYIIDSLGNISYTNFKNPIVWMSEDRTGIIWIASLWNGVTGYKNMDFTQPVYHLVPDMSVTSICNDSEGGYWISTLENGILYLPHLQIKPINNTESITAGKISQVEYFNGKIWFSGNSSHLYSFANGKTTTHSWLLNRVKKITLLKSIDKYLFISGYGKETIGGIWENDKNKWITDNYFYDIVELSGSKIVPFRSSIFIYDYIANTQTPLFMTLENHYCAYKLNDSVILLGRNDGLFSLNINTRKLYSYNNIPLLSHRINCIYPDSKNNIWLGTKGTGLVKFSPEKPWNIDTKDGLPGNTVNAIIEGDSCLWIATNKGIGKLMFTDIEKHKYSIQSITKSTGLPSNEVFDLTKDSASIYAATGNGLCFFAKEFMPANITPPPVYIERILVNGKKTESNKNIILEPGENQLEIQFTGISYWREKPLIYLYKLDGYNSNWQSTTNLTITYASLPSGSFTFYLKAVNENGIESKQCIKLPITIGQHFYETLSFRISVLILASLIISLLFVFILKIKLKMARRRDNMQNELNNYRQKLLSAQLDAHFIYNALNSVQSYILRNDREKASYYLSAFGQLLRNVLAISQSVSISLEDELETLKLYVQFEQIRFKTPFIYEVNITPEINLSSIKIPPLLLQPYIENAIHHGLTQNMDKGKIELSIYKEDDDIRISISDNGIGIKESSKKRQALSSVWKSYGMDISQQRLQLYHDLFGVSIDVLIEDNTTLNKHETGTCVILNLKKTKNEKTKGYSN